MAHPSSPCFAGVLAAALVFAAAPAGAAPDVANGKKKFDGICVQCHRSDGEGMTGMGMNLTEAPLVKTGSVGAIAKFIATGHPPTKDYPLGMPPGGGESLSAADRTDIAAYLKTLAK
ncbi:MAG: cytochrome c [Candidatus Binatia bacterium]|nr:cytochrome c [Candidatus Binatia bacterium]